MRLRLPGLLLTALLWAPSLFAAEVERVDKNGSVVFLKNFNAREWKVGDPVCVFQKGSLAGCGTLAGLTPTAGVVRLSETKLALILGDSIEVRRNARLPATTESVRESIADHRSATFDVALGLNAGFTYYYPMAHIQLALSRNFSIGLLPVFASYSGTNRSTSFVGGYLTGTYYYTHYAFKGVFFEGGAGLVSIKANSGSVSGESSPFGVRALVGWRGRALWDIGLDIGVGAGIQYVFLDQSVVDTSFKGFLPLAQVTLAYSFE